MKKTNKPLMQYAGFGILFLASSQTVMADDASPLSPKFVLQPNQILSTTNIAYTKVDFETYYYTPSVGFIPASVEITDKSIAQSIKLGLTDNYEVGIGETYNSAKSSRPEVVGVLDGFTNPTIFAKKTWGANSNTLFNANLSATPKTGDSALRATPTIYNLGIGTALTTPSGLVTTIGLSRTMINGMGSANSTTIQLGAYKELGSYTLNASGSLNLSENSSVSISTGLGRQVTTNSWLLISYQHTSASYRSNALGASLKVLF